MRVSENAIYLVIMHCLTHCTVSLNIGLRATTSLRRKPNNRLVK